MSQKEKTKELSDKIRYMCYENFKYEYTLKREKQNSNNLG